MVLVWVARMLRGWLALYKEEAGERLEGLIVNLEELSRRPAQIEWMEEVSTESSSSLVLSGAQSLGVARSDPCVAESCNGQFDQTASECMHCA